MRQAMPSAFDFAILQRQFDEIGVADQVMGEVIEADRQRAVVFRTHPGVAAMVEQVSRSKLTPAFLRGSFRRQRRKVPGTVPH